MTAFEGVVIVGRDLDSPFSLVVVGSAILQTRRMRARARTARPLFGRRLTMEANLRCAGMGRRQSLLCVVLFASEFGDIAKRQTTKVLKFRFRAQSSRLSIMLRLSFGIALYLQRVELVSNP